MLWTQQHGFVDGNLANDDGPSVSIETGYLLPIYLVLFMLSYEGADYLS